MAAARVARDEARKFLANGADPGLEKQRAKERVKSSAGERFGDIACEYITKRTKEGWADATKAKAEWLLEFFKGSLDRFPVSEITPSDILPILKRVEAKGNHETARRLLQLASSVFRYALAIARLTSDPTRDLRGALTCPRAKHYGAIVDPLRAGELRRAIDGYEGNYITKFALQLAPHVFLRPGELRRATWAEIDLDTAIRAIPAARMKIRKPHHVLYRDRQSRLYGSCALSVAIGRAWCFRPSEARRGRLNAALRRLGFDKDEMTSHGFRAMASTLLNVAP